MYLKTPASARSTAPTVLPERPLGGLFGWLCALLPALLLMLPCAARAALGGDAASVSADQAGMQATQHVAETQLSTGAGLYTVRDMTLPSGTTVREYIGADGVVFGVTWQGPFMPDLAQLFGNYFTEFVTAAKAAQLVHGAHRGPLRIAQSDLVVQSGGRMRAFIGRAYLPQELPQGVSLDEIK